MDALESRSAFNKITALLSCVLSQDSCAQAQRVRAAILARFDEAPRNPECDYRIEFVMEL